MKTIVLFLQLLLTISVTVYSQVSINTDGSAPDSTAALEVKSSNKGFLPPRLTTTQRDAIADPADGLMIYNYDNHRIEYFDGQDWRQMFQQTSGDVICGNDFFDSRDNKIYGTVLIGSQCWMAESLNHGTRIDGNIDMTQNGTIEKYCYDNDESNCTNCGALYQWEELMAYNLTDSSGICPDGWHVPSKEEFNQLAVYLGGTSVAGGKLKITGTTYWATPNTGATNEATFDAKGSGYRIWSAPWYNNKRYFGYFWTSTRHNEENAWTWELRWDTDDFLSFTNNMNWGYQVRCIKD